MLYSRQFLKWIKKHSALGCNAAYFRKFFAKCFYANFPRQFIVQIDVKIFHTIFYFDQIKVNNQFKIGYFELCSSFWPQLCSSFWPQLCSSFFIIDGSFVKVHPFINFINFLCYLILKICYFIEEKMCRFVSSAKSVISNFETFGRSLT